ncbi:hypothetical protein LTR36_009013 [Oleoguttula mirabilis]|uniref:Uncharacterized protein n=1 Tax=Oleoguttula mirabilis TaxID=1507867 RepID=A0AAV9J783_9PEZI|nr:hypothetical protein LTR36_009013 [Oleoguttula mirabilis]
MSPRLHLVRHGQGSHELEPLQENQQRPDPVLTDLGVQQCKAFNAAFPEYIHIDLVCASPMRRAILTAKYCFASALQRTGSILLLPLAQEDSAAPADTGSAPEVLRAEFGDLVDLSMVKEGWNIKEGVNAPTPQALRERARKLRHELQLRPEKEVAVVSHGTFLQYLIGNVDADGQSDEAWTHQEWRSYKFVTDDGGEARLVEEQESVIRRHVLA